MFHSTVIAAAIRKMEGHYGKPLIEHSVKEVQEWRARLDPIADDDGNPTRNLSPEESAFVENELKLTKVSYPYWAQRYCIISKEGAGIGPMYPLLESQEFVLKRLADLELKIYQGEREHGLLANVLKAARQVGVSTLAESIAAHRITSQENIFGLIAADVPEQSAYLFGMMERIIDGLPWWLRPVITDRVKNTEIKTDGGSNIWVGAGKSTRGASGARGQLGRGRALSVVHLSELSTWEAGYQIDGALIPTLPKSPRTIALFESTAKGRGNWWHKHWVASRSGVAHHFVPIFIPWYVEKRKYSLKYPADWVPSESTVAHARRCEETAQEWTGHGVKLTKAQLYWYEITRASYEAKGDLKTFIEEFGAVDDEECFQHSGYSIFSVELQQAIRDMASAPIALVDVKPARELVAR